jgi:hypothetical protein
MQIGVSDGALTRIHAEFPAISAVPKKQNEMPAEQAIAKDVQPFSQGFAVRPTSTRVKLSSVQASNLSVMNRPEPPAK